MSNPTDFVIKNGVLEKYKGRDSDVIVPEGVTCIGDYAFLWCWSLKSVTLPEGLTSIGKEAFSGCSSLRSVTLPEGLTSIEDSAFFRCSSLTSVNLPEGLKSIGTSAFYECESLRSVTLPEGLTSIGDSAFFRCSSLTSVNLPEGLKSIGRWAFSGCKKLADENGFVIVGGILFNYYGTGGDIVVPDGVTSIENGVFKGCSSLTSVNLPEGLTSIGDSAFSDCSSLASVSLAEGLTSIGDSAFSDCSSLTSVNLPEGLTSIGDSAFSRCSSLTSVNLPEGLTSIGDQAFFDCKGLTEIVIPDSVRNLGNALFDSCSAKLFVRMPEQALIGRKQALAEGGSLLLQIRQGSESFLLAYGSKKQNDILESYGTPEFWKDYDRAFSNEDYKFSAAVKLLGAAGRLLCSKGLDKRNRIFYRNRLRENAAKAVSAAQKYCLPEVVRVLFTDGIVNEENEAEVRKQLKMSKKPAFSMLADLPLAAKDDEQQKALPAEAVLDKLMEEEHLTEEQLEKQMKDTFGIIQSALPGLKDTEGCLLKPAVLAFLMILFAEESMYPSKFVQAKNLAEQILSLIDRASLQSALRELSDAYFIMYQQGKKTLLTRPVCRYADEELMRELCARAPKWATTVSGDDAPMLREFRKAVCYSDTFAAMLFADRYNELEKYAALRETDADTIRDKYLSDVGLDESRGKTYDLGNQSVTARLQKDLSFLFELPNGKIAKSLPKRGADEDKYAAAKADFNEMRKSVKKILKNRFDRLFEDFLIGRARVSADWQTSYLHNPLLRDAASRLIWAQGDQTFTLTDTGVIDCDGNPYTIMDEPIRVAHPMEMKAEDIKAWQKYVTKHGIRQPFLQVWEPVRMADQILPDRYAGIELDIMTFNGKEKHGIHSYGLHAYSEAFGFTLDDCTVDYDCSTCRLGFEIGFGETYKLGEFRFPTFTRKVNHIVTILDGLTVEDRIVKDDVTVAEAFPGYTLAQITEFIAAAQEAKANNVLALLLDYKAKTFPDFDPMDEFTLEWC